jgi:hypothetical protein
LDQQIVCLKLDRLSHSRAPQVRRAYRRLALQLHPDKAVAACRYATRCAGCGAPAFDAEEAQARLQDRATWLFKLLGGWDLCCCCCCYCCY